MQEIRVSNEKNGRFGVDVDVTSSLDKLRAKLLGEDFRTNGFDDSTTPASSNR
jgi:hypothetical protein